MQLPVRAILSAFTPLALNALEQYRKRQEAKAAEAAAGGEPITAEALRTRLWELEASDLEQSRLLGELSRGVESLANAFAASVEEAQRRQTRMERMLWGMGGVALVSLGLSVWALAR